MSTPADEPMNPEVPRGSIEAVDASSIDAASIDETAISAPPTPFASEPIGVTLGRTLVTPESIAQESIAPESIAPESIAPESIEPESIEPESIERTSVERTSVEPMPATTTMEAMMPAPVTADEPAVSDVAPLAVAAGPAVAAAQTTVERIAPIVVKTRTGPVALDEQSPAPTPARPAPIAIRDAATSTPIVVKPTRLASLDIFRGITIAMMVLVNNEGVGHPYVALDHAGWNGWTPTDLVFPFFLFIVGVATPFSLLRRSMDPLATRGTVLGHIWLRALSLMLLGWLLGGTNLPWPFPGIAPGVWLTRLLHQDPLLLPNLAPPDGFAFTKILRGAGFVLAFGGVLALLVPWRSRRMQAIVPLATFGLLLAYCVAMHFVRANALANHWPEETFGSAGLFNPDRLRIPGVLVRIGLCYGVAASIALVAGRVTIVATIVTLFAIYSVLMLTPKLGGGSLGRYDNLERKIDVFVFERWHLNDEGKAYVTQKHTYGPYPDPKGEGYPDPEGLLSTLPAIGSALIGVLAGLWLRSVRPAVERCAGLLAWGVATTCVGVLMSWWLMPVNKQLWTPSFTVLTAGLAMLGLGLVFYVADVRGRRAWAWPFKVFGMNAIAAFVASTILARLSSLFVFIDPRTHKRASLVGWLDADVAHRIGGAQGWLDAHGVVWLPLNTPQNTSLAGALAFVCVIFVLMLALYVCRIFVKV